MEKQLLLNNDNAATNGGPLPRQRSSPLVKVTAAAALLVLASFYLDPFAVKRPSFFGHHCPHAAAPAFETLPKSDDPFHFIPCTHETLPPAIGDQNPEEAWAKLYEPNPENWSWGKPVAGQNGLTNDPYAGRGIYLCGYIDVPMDYTNKSDPRISRQSITKYQVSGLRRRDEPPGSPAGRKSVRTLVVEPGGPGGAGSGMVWGAAEDISRRWSNSTLDILGWDPRGVNATYPSIYCFPSDAHRERWRLLTEEKRRSVGDANSLQQLKLADALNDAAFQYCLSKYGDLPRFMTTAFVARDLEQIRLALGEEEVSGFMVSYGTGVGQTYAAMFPDTVGRLILDGNEMFSDYYKMGDFAYHSFYNTTDTWREGFLTECVNAGPDNCPLAKSHKEGEVVTLESLESRMNHLFGSLVEQPMSGYSDTHGPGLILYNFVSETIFEHMYAPFLWPRLASLLADLENGNTSKALDMMNNNWWMAKIGAPIPQGPPFNYELIAMVICPEAFDDEAHDLGWWDSTWGNMTQKSFLSGDQRFYFMFSCRKYLQYWPEPAEVYRGGYEEKTLRTPLLLISGSHDPTTPLENGRRLQKAFGWDNARLVAHHGYGHGSHADISDCTEEIGRRYILNGILPDASVTHCYPNTKPFDTAGLKSLEGLPTIWDLRMRHF